MSTLKASRTAQWPLVQEFRFTWEDLMANSLGNSVDFGKVNLGGAAGFFDIIPLPPNAIVIGGEVETLQAFDTAGYDVTIGDSAVTNRYLASTDLKGAGRQVITPTGYLGAGENIRFGFTSDDVCTQGEMCVRIWYVVKNRSNEVQIQ